MAGTAEAPLVAAGGVQSVGLQPPCAGDRSEDRLGDPGASLDREGFIAGIQHDDLDFTPIVFVDRPGRVGQDNSVAQGKTGAGSDLQLVTGRQGDRRRLSG